MINEFKNKNHQYIHDNINEIVDNCDKIIQDESDQENISEFIKVYEYIGESYFNLERFDLIIKMYDNLCKIKIDSYPILMYTLLSCIGLKDVYLALSYMKRSKLLTDDLKWYLDEDGCNYYNYLKENKDIQLLLIVVVFIKNNANMLINNMLLEDSEKNINAKSCEIGVSFYELISTLYEIGYSMEVIKRLNEIGYILFK